MNSNLVNSILEGNSVRSVIELNMPREYAVQQKGKTLQSFKSQKELVDFLDASALPIELADFYGAEERNGVYQNKYGDWVVLCYPELTFESSSKRACYLCHSERADRRSDEKDVEIYTDKILEPGDEFQLDGLTWYVDEILKDVGRGIGEAKSFKGSGMRIDFEDDIVIVYDKDGNEVYRGLEDYEPMKNEDWKFDDKIGAYRFKDFIKNCVA